jgi:hypothetical protein
MRDEVIDRVFTDAQSVVQAEIQKVTRRLDSDGKYKTLPADWETQRPKWDRVAQSIVELVRKNQKLDIPLPAVTTKNDGWIDQQSFIALEGLGNSSMRQGTVSFPASDVLFWARELKSGSGVIPVQVGIPIDAPFTDPITRNRSYVTITAGVPESAPASMDEIRTDVTADWRAVQGFESLKSRSDELKKIAIEKGLPEVAALFPAVPSEGDANKNDPNTKPLEVLKDARVERSGTSALRASLFTDDEFRTPLNTLADQFESMPFTESIPVDRATTTIAVPKRLTLAVLTIKRIMPFTREDFLSKESMSLIRAGRAEMAATKMDSDPFALADLLKRHRYETKGVRVETPEQFQNLDNSDSNAPRKGS